MTINVDGSVTVADDGRGIPVEVHPDLGISTLEGVMTKLKFGGKFDKRAYKTSGGLHGIGVKVVNFLSEWCEVEVRRGRATSTSRNTSAACRPGRRPPHRHAATARGTKTTFKPDPQIFGNTKFDYNMLYKRLQELAFLNRGVKIVFKDKRTGQGETFQYERGMLEFIEHLNRASEPAHADIIYIDRRAGRRRRRRSPCNTPANTPRTNTPTSTTSTPVDGGTHLSGFRTALTRTLTSYGKKAKIFKDLVPSGEDFARG